MTSVSISPDGKFLIGGCLDQNIRVWSLETGELKEVVEGHKNSVYSVNFSSDGQSFVSASLDKTIKVWSFNDKALTTCKTTITGHKDFVLSAGFTFDGQYIISGSKDRSVQIWDTKTFDAQVMLQGHKNSVISISACPVAPKFATGSGDMRVRLWRYYK